MSSTITSTQLTKNEETEPVTKCAPRKYEYVYRRIIILLYYHLAGVYGLYVAFSSAKWLTLCLASTNLLLAVTGVTAGAHRLWSHRSYKAHWSLQLFLMLCHSIANQSTLLRWVRDHRVHHKYSDTDADPHNANRGFFFSHFGWLLVKKHAEVISKGKKIDVSDLKSNPIVMFQYRHKLWFMRLVSFILPTVIPVYLWQETVSNAWHINILRYVINLNMAFMINSFAHLQDWGYRPYDKNIAPAQNLAVFYLTLGEGSHNFHHVFPSDYRTDGLGLFNVMTRFIDACATLGLVSDRKVVDDEMIKARMRRTGDGSFY